MAEVLVDPEVARRKFDAELATVATIEADLLRRGIWILSATFPNVLVAFAAPRIRPVNVYFGAVINFDNYDLQPPSVRFVDPLTREALLRGQILSPFVRLVNGAPQPLLLGRPNDVPFLCLPGVREYHDHPAHTGDSWLLHRGTGEGNLYFLLDKICRYGTEPIAGIGFSFNLNVDNIPE